MLIDMLGVTLFIVSSPNSEKKKNVSLTPGRIEPFMQLWLYLLRFWDISPLRFQEFVVLIVLTNEI